MYESSYDRITKEVEEAFKIVRKRRELKDAGLSEKEVNLLAPLPEHGPSPYQRLNFMGPGPQSSEDRE